MRACTDQVQIVAIDLIDQQPLWFDMAVAVTTLPRSEFSQHSPWFLIQAIHGCNLGKDPSACRLAAAETENLNLARAVIVWIFGCPA